VVLLGVWILSERYYAIWIDAAGRAIGIGNGQLLTAAWVMAVAIHTVTTPAWPLAGWMSGTDILRPLVVLPGYAREHER